MEEVIPHIYISSLEAANDKGLRTSRGITHIVSIGCQLDDAAAAKVGLKTILHTDGIEYSLLQYPEIRDLPDALICGAFQETNSFISEAISSSSSSSVLVHCVYGQSRSATIVLAYLIEHHAPKLSLEEAFTLLKAAKPDICVNPGFLSQLHLMYHRANFSAEYQLLSSMFGVNSSKLRVRKRKAVRHDSKIMRCRKCKESLFEDAEATILSVRDDKEFIDAYCDPYWKGYYAPYTGKHLQLSAQIDDGMLIVTHATPVLRSELPIRRAHSSSSQQSGPLAVRLRDVDVEGELVCPNCEAELGVWRSSGLALLRGFILTPLFALRKKCIYTAPAVPPTSSRQESTSTVVHVTGIRRNVTDQDLMSHFSVCGRVIKVEFPENPLTQTRLGYALVHMSSPKEAQEVVQILHYKFLKGKALSIRLEDTGMEASRVQSRANFAVTRQVQELSKKEVANYTGRTLVLSNGNEYPIPQGTYLTHLLRRFHSSQLPFLHQPLFDVLLQTRHGKKNKRSKELSESLAMVNAVIRAGHVANIPIEKMANVRVFAVADGVAPFSAAALGLSMPDTWEYWSIDPVLDFDSSSLGSFSERFHMAPHRSQDFDIPLKRSVNEMSIVIACHSHAPLQEFYNRIPSPKIAVVMPCCGKTWSSLVETPIDVYDDFEVLSPRRKIYLYYTPDP